MNGAELTTWKIVVNGTYTELPAAAPRGAGTPPPGTRAGRLIGLLAAREADRRAPFLTLKFDAVSVEQGKEVDLAVKVNKAVDFPGEAKVTLVGLPNKATTEPATITKDSTEVVFHLKTDAATPAGRDQEPVLPGRRHPGRRADRPQPRHRPAPDRRPSSAKPTPPPRRRRPHRRTRPEAAQPAGEAPPGEPGAAEGQERGGRPGPPVRRSVRSPRAFSPPSRRTTRPGVPPARLSSRRLRACGKPTGILRALPAPSRWRRTGGNGIVRRPRE